jgi:hypothetical protein
MAYGSTPYSPLGLACVIGLTFVSGCTGASQTGAPFAPGSASQPMRSVPSVRTDSPKYLGARELYVVDTNSGSIKILKNKSYAELGQITSGIFNPTSVFLDKHGNLYVANSTLPSVTEYPPNSTTPSFTYSDHLMEALVVTADSHDNVFVVDDVSKEVWQYFQGSNTVAAECSPSGTSQMSGIAVDSKNDVFVSFDDGELIEYPGGLSGCNETVLGASPSAAFGMTVDKQGDLVVCDLAAGAVDVIAPPYSSVTRTFGSGLVEPVNVTLNRTNRLAFVVDYDKDVQVYDYQTGTLLTTLGTVYGLVSPLSAVDGPNAVY